MAQAMLAVQAFSQVSETYSEYTASQIDSRNQRTKADIESRFMRLQATDAIERGDEEANRINTETKRVRGQQRAGYAGQGVQTDSGSAGAVGAETEMYGAVDATTAKANAWRQAWGLRSEADNVQAEGRAKAKAAERQRRMTIITGGLKLAKTGMQSASLRNSGSYVPRNPTESRYDREYRSGR